MLKMPLQDVLLKFKYFLKTSLRRVSLLNSYAKIKIMKHGHQMNNDYFEEEKQITLKILEIAGALERADT